MSNIKCGCNMSHCHDKCSPLQANLVGLQGNLNFQLFRLKGCRVEVNVECSGQEQVVMGKICNVGTNFVSIHVDEGQPGEKVVTIVTERIGLIEWPDKNCSPCKDPELCNSSRSYD